jgi:Na+-transporting methylmalonyl-CoA/oxaloacetate decarboxylase gamma subunit
MIWLGVGILLFFVTLLLSIYYTGDKIESKWFPKNQKKETKDIDQECPPK